VHETRLNAIHRQLGAKMVDFSGWDMPLFYEGIIPEHRAVRQAAGMFDVSHMGEFRIRGGEAEAYLDRMVTNRVAGMADGQALYTALCYENGGAVDDLIVYRLAPGDYTMVVNASNIEKDFAWLVEHRIPGVELENVSEETALLAVQGPRSAELVALAAGAASADIAYYHFRRMSVFGVEATVARLGYTGEDGFEIMFGAEGAEQVWGELLRVGRGLGLVPTGLGARDTLRFEAGFCLYGHELTAETGPLEAGIGFAVKLDKEDFIGAEALRRQKEVGVPRRVVGVKMDGSRIPRQACKVRRDGSAIGEVTSGMFSPTLDGAYALALVQSGTVRPGDAVEVLIRDRGFAGRIVSKPFYKRAR
jgi:aminomethyltransferase